MINARVIPRHNTMKEDDDDDDDEEEDENQKQRRVWRKVCVLGITSMARWSRSLDRGTAREK